MQQSEQNDLSPIRRTIFTDVFQNKQIIQIQIQIPMKQMCVSLSLSLSLCLSLFLQSTRIIKIREIL